MDKTTARQLLFLLVSIIILYCPVSAHSPSDMQIVPDLEAGNILVTLDHRVDDSSRHFVREVVLVKNGVTIDTVSYTSQPSAGTFSYQYLLPLQEGDEITVSARCNIGGSITREITVPYPGASVHGDPLPAQTVSYDMLWPAHAALMVAGLFCFLIAALFPALKRGKEGWFRDHTRFAAAGAALTFIALGIAFSMVYLSGGPHIRVPHAFLGILVLVLLLITVSLALLRTRLRPHTLQVLAAHRWAGRVLILVMAITLLSGLFTAGLFS